MKPWGFWFTRAQWFGLPMWVRYAWWEETDYSRKPPSWSLFWLMLHFFYSEFFREKRRK